MKHSSRHGQCVEVMSYVLGAMAPWKESGVKVSVPVFVEAERGVQSCVKNVRGTSYSRISNFSPGHSRFTQPRQNNKRAPAPAHSAPLSRAVYVRMNLAMAKSVNVPE